MKSLAPTAADVAASLEKSTRLVDVYIKAWPQTLKSCHESDGSSLCSACTFLNWLQVKVFDNTRCLQAFFLTGAEELGQWAVSHPEYTRKQHMSLAASVAQFKGLKKKDHAAFVARVGSFITVV